MADVTNKQDAPKEAEKAAKQTAELHKAHETKKVEKVEAEKKMATEVKAEKKAEQLKTTAAKEGTKPATAGKDDKKDKN